MPTQAAAKASSLDAVFAELTSILVSYTAGLAQQTACLFLAGIVLICVVVPYAAAQTCGLQGVALQVLGSGGPELQDKRASSSYLVWENGQ